MLALLRGEDLFEYRKQKLIRERIRKSAKKYRKAPVENWPKIVMNWDVSPESQRFSFDGQSKKEFDDYYPQGLCLGYVQLHEFDKVLCHYSRRDEGELWKVGDDSKLAYLIVYLSEGGSISPPVVKPLDNGEVIFTGGHHRYAIAKVIGEKRIPIYVCPEHKLEVGKRVTVEWA